MKFKKFKMRKKKLITLPTIIKNIFNKILIVND